MRKHLFFLLGTVCISFSYLQAQNWVNGGNTLAANGTLGTNSSHSLLFETSGAERGRITNGGNWGIGTTSPLSKLAVNSAASTSPFRASIAGVHKFIVNGNGGVSIGSATAGPANGLYVAGNVGIGTATPSQKLHVVGSGLFTTGVTVSSGTVSSSSNYGSAIYGSSANGYGVYGTSTSSYAMYATSGYIGVFGNGTSYGLYGNSTNNIGVNGNSGYIGVSGSGGTYGVRGFSSGGLAIYGTSNEGTGVYGTSINRKGGYFVSTNEIALWARTGRADKNWAGVFEGNVYTFNAYVTSDKNLKNHIEDVGDALSIINQLKPKSYEFRRDGKLAHMNLPKGRHYGVLAQDLEEVLPNLVMEVENEVSPLTNGETPIAPNQPSESTEKITIKAVNYTELIPVLVKAIQELSMKNNELQQKVEDLNQRISKMQQSDVTNILDYKLGQNTPNPAKGIASVQYSVPEGSNRAQLLITDALGRMYKTIQLTTSGTVRIDVSSLASGVYNYSLIVDNKTVITRKMTVVQ